MCAQHCLNAVLQGSYFTAVDLSEIAMGLDEEERKQMSENENGVESWVISKFIKKNKFPKKKTKIEHLKQQQKKTIFLNNREDYKQFLEQPSGNMDDTGFFSVQVISKALSLWNLDLIPLNSTDGIATGIRENPTKAQAYIFNMQSHWYCIRKFKCHENNQSPSNDAYAYFNLDSLLSRPEYMSSSFLTEYLKQMQNEGYSIFIVSGDYPECNAEPITYLPNFNQKPTDFIDLTKSESKASVTENDEDIQRAIQLSLADYSNKYDRYMPTELMASGSNSIATTSTDNNADLDAALKLSLECFNGPGQELSSTTKTETLTQNQLRDKRLAYFNAMSSNNK